MDYLVWANGCNYQEEKAQTLDQGSFHISMNFGKTCNIHDKNNIKQLLLVTLNCCFRNIILSTLIKYIIKSWISLCTNIRKVYFQHHLIIRLPNLGAHINTIPEIKIITDMKFTKSSLFLILVQNYEINYLNLLTMSQAWIASKSYFVFLQR